VGKLFSGEIDYLQSFGLLSSGLYIPLAAVLPYIISFYLVLGIMEDVGYLPRLAVLLDTILHKLGLHGYAIIPTILGMGCNVPAIMATRILESRRERLIAATLISIAVPCASMQAMVVGLVGKEGIQYVIMVYFTLFLVWIVVGYTMNRLVRGFSPELLIEIPPYRVPMWTVVGKKLWLRVLGFLREALPVVLGAIFVINILYTIGIFNFIADITAPVISGLLGLPKESVIALIIGFLRKDVAMGMLAPLSLTPGQLVISSTVMAMSFPCVATFVVLLRELGVKDTLKATGIMLLTALIVGSLLNLIF
jgi:ferrous iron transport protein B